MKASLSMRKGSISSDYYYVIEIEIGGNPYAFQLSEAEYFTLNECDDRDDRAIKTHMETIVSRLNQPGAQE